MHNSKQEECRRNQLHLIMILHMTLFLNPQFKLDPWTNFVLSMVQKNKVGNILDSVVLMTWLN